MNKIDNYLKILNEGSEIGKHNDISDSKFNSKELKMGIEIEKEHTDDPAIAKKIAKDHLFEFPDYYTRLKKMEDEAKKHWKKPKDEDVEDED